MSNGLGSPLCKGVLGSEDLSPPRRRACETSGFVAAASPTGNFGLDVHIDTGFLGLSSGSLDRAVEDLVVTPVWMSLVWAVHALVVMLEWSFTIDLLDDASVDLGRGLRAAQAHLTYPWLACVLAVAAIATAYHGLIRRRVADALGQVLLAGAMMAAGLWVILDPTGTVGALGGWANQASLGTLAVSSDGSPGGAGRALGDSMAGVFATAIEAPWCYLEFGDVGWCRNPQRRDPELYAAGLAIARRELAQVSCSGSSGPLALCVAPGSNGGKALLHSVQLLRAARSNGAIFLALPANGPQRNSINDQSSLLRVMCQSSDANSCKGRMAAQAQFRTRAATWKRFGGLLLIVAGALGMLLVFGFIALRLLGAAIFSLLYLLLAPAAVLAPALGEVGRSVFRRWAAGLLAAVVSKLLFGFLLGAMLAVVAVLAGLEGLGWWTQWLLMSAFWWGAYGRRHVVLGMAGGVLGERGSPPSLARRAAATIDSPRRLIGAASAVGRWFGVPERDPARHHTVARTASRRALDAMDAQARRLLEHDARPGTAAGEREHSARAADLRAQLTRIESERAKARASGDRRRELELVVRARRVERELAAEPRAAVSVTGRGAAAKRPAPRGAHAGGGLEQAGSFLDRQAGLAPSVAGAPARRDYPALAALIGQRREEYERLTPDRQRLARIEIDRELALRDELPRISSELGREARAAPGRREAREAERALQGAVQRQLRARGQALPISRTPWLDAWSRRGRISAGAGRDSPVMRDAREVLRRRKRQLGTDEP